jgi:LPXTG-site transpeptidase (sortase) family protein
MATETSSRQSVNEKPWTHLGKIIIACGVAAILCWVFIQSAQSSSALVRAPGASKQDVLTGPHPEVLAQIANRFAITKTHEAGFTIGQPGGTFNIQISNISTGTITGTLTVIDNLPTGLTLVSGTGGGFSCGPAGGQNITCTNANAAGLPAGDSLTIQLGVNVTSTVASVITNTATLTHEGESISDSDQVTISAAGADLAVTKSVTPSNPRVTDPVTFRVRLTNQGPSPAAGVVLTDTLAANLAFSSATPPTGTTYDSSSGRWVVGDLAVNAPITLTLVANVSSTAYGLSITDATNGLSSNTSDPNSANNTGSATIQVQGPDLAVEKTDGKQTILPNETYNYTISVVNQGTVTAPDYIITDTLSDYLSFITYTFSTEPDNFEYTKSGDLLIWSIEDDLAPNDETVLTVRVKADSTLPSSTTKIINKAEVSTSIGETSLTNNSNTDEDTPSGTRNVSISNSVSPTSVQTGNETTYTIKVTNSGSGGVTDVEVTDTFSQYVDIVSHKTSKGSDNLSSRTLTVNIGSLNAGQSATITVKVKVNNVATTNTTVSNYAYMTYKFGSTTYSGSASVNFSLVRSSTLPGTGGIELPTQLKESSPSRVYLVSLISALLLVLLGVIAMGIGLWARGRRPEWSGFAYRMGMMFVAASLFFGLVTWALIKVAGLETVTALTALTKSGEAVKATPPWPDDPAWIGEYFQGEPEVLPDFPIPEPTNVPPDENGEKPDTSPINRIVVPILGVDTVVKYVPYDGFTWLIAGLQQEVAWMGDTSWPGLGGNTALAGHVTLRNGRDGPFRHLDELRQNDEVVLYTDENIYNYKVRELRVVLDGEMSVIAPTNSPQLTLITCTNFDREAGIYLERLVIYADLIGTKPLDIALR